MYLRDGKQMREPEEGAAFFEPVSMGQMIPPRTMGIDMDLLTRGFPGTRGVGAEDPASAPAPSFLYAPWYPWLIGGVAAVGGFMFWRKR